MSSSSSAAPQKKALTKAQQDNLQQLYSSQKQALQALAQKISELETETDEHTLVLDTLQPLPADRKCFRMVGGVLAERTVGEVVPALESNLAGIKQVMEQLLEQYKKKEAEFVKFQRENKIQVVG
ncbi:hypothetical protein YB2330_003161 [Saitoella coloradoensis]